MSSDITLGETIYRLFTTRAFATGIPGTLGGTPAVVAYENESTSQITGGITLGVDHDSKVGLNLLTIVATGGNGFESGKDYAMVIGAGTVDGVSVVGEVVSEFTIGRSAAAVDLANGTDGLGAIKTDTAAILVDVTGINGADLDSLVNALVLTTATIETVTSQTQFVIPATADATDDEAYHGATAIFIDGTDANQKSMRLVTNYDSGTRTITVQNAPDFTITTSDTITVLAVAYVEGVWDQILTGATHNINNSAGKRLRQVEQAFNLASGTIDTVTNGHTVTLDTGAVATAEFYEHARLQIIEGTGAGQSRIIVGYTSGRVVTLDSDFVTNPDTASLYEIVAADVHVSVSSMDLATGFVATATSTTQITLDAAAEADADFYNEMLIVFTHGTGAGQATHITAYTSGRVATMSPALDVALSTDTVYHIQGITPISQEVKEIWDEAMVASTGAPAITGSMRAFMEWWATLSRNVVNQTATTTTVRNDADDGDISTSAVSDDGTTFVRGEFST